ncbi:MAG: NADPH-dependent glutamate synthase [Tissierellia bacterium]|jgi:glutamate synthase (NADPH/NADH) small chain|nr:NADPH-dependent glutamate synthase [Bacillota bacterium]NLL23440.1 NADPH-dependent glutamate synthase [Tissierellia bacterium]
MAKRNMSPQKVEMPTQDPLVRARNFKEVAHGYTEEMAREEALRCLQCKHKPCMNGCPVNVKIPEFIQLIVEGDYIAANQKILETNVLPAVCGRVCPQESQCEQLCVRGIKHEPVAIGRLERFVADYFREHSEPKPHGYEKNGIKVAVIGSGPAGLSCAGDLARLGYDVTIFESLPEGGGVLVYGIPEFRLPNDIVKHEIEQLKLDGVKLETNVIVGRSITIDELFDEYGFEAVFVGSGAGLPVFLGIPGENSVGVYSANEYLTRSNLMRAYDDRYDTPIRKSKCVAVVGGGNVAMDSARTALRLGAEKVYIVYRRSFDEMPARVEEVHHAQEEGVIFNNLTNPVAVLHDERGEVTGMKCIRMELGEPDASGRRRPIPIEGSEFDLEVDTIVIAVGTNPNPLIKSTTEGLDVTSWGGIITDEFGATSREGIFAGGDAVTGAATVISAAGAGKVAAEAIDKYLKNKHA